MDREAPPPPGTIPGGMEDDMPGASGGSGSGAGTGEGADPPPDPTVDAAAGDRFGGGTGGGIYTADTPVSGQGVGEAGGTEDVDDSEQGKVTGSRLVSEHDTRALIMEIQAGVKEVLREQHAIYLAKIDRGVLLQEDVLDRLRAIQLRLDTSPMTNTAALEALAQKSSCASTPAPKTKTARPQLAALTPQTEESVATGKGVRQSFAEVKDHLQDRIQKTSGRASLIMPPEVTEDVGGDEHGGSRKSNFSQRFQSFSVVPSEVRPVQGDRDRDPESEADEEDEDGEDGDSEDGTKQRKKKKKKCTRKPAKRRMNHGPLRHAGWDMQLPSVRDKELGFWLKVTKHPSFDFFSGALIVASTVVAGTETNYMAQHEGNTTETYYMVKMFFLACFTVELTLRMLGAGLPAFFVKKDKGWNCFDFIMVGASVFEVIVQLAQGGDHTSPSGGGQGRILRILRIVRISRALRLGRVLRYARTFRQIVYSLQSSIVTLFWAMVMIFLVVYCFAVCFCQAWTEWVSDQQGVPMPSMASAELKLLYSSLGRSLYSLFMAMTGGRSWGELLAPLMYISELYTVLFVLFICLTYFGVLNVVAAIFVDSAMQSQQHYKDLLIQDNVEKKELFSQHLREVFLEIDRDGSGHINGDEMEFFLADPSLNLYLESIDIFPNDARSLFRLLDRDGSGEVSIEEFCQGCLRLKGEAKSFDIHCLIYANDRSQRKLDQIINWLTQAVPMD